MSSPFLDYYDWVVLGDHPGALLSGCLAARMGYSVLIVPLEKRFQSGVSRSGQFFDPETNFVLGLGSLERLDGVIGDTLYRLGMDSSFSSLMEQTDQTIPQILTPQARVSLKRGNKAFFSELVRELGSSVVSEIGLESSLDLTETLSTAFWKRFQDGFFESHRKNNTHSKGPFATKSVDAPQALKHYISQRTFGAKGEKRWWFSPKACFNQLHARLEHRPLKELLLGFWYGAVTYDEKNPSLQELLHLMALTRGGVAVEGGMTVFRRELLRLAKGFGAHYPEGHSCRRIFVENKTLLGVQLAGVGKMIGIRGAVSGASFDHVSSYFSFSRDDGYRNLKVPPRPKGWRFTVALSVHEEAIPPGMNRRAIWKEEGSPCLEIEVADPEEFRLGTKTGKLIFLRTVLPYTAETLEPSYQKTVAARMFRKLSELFPFLEYHVTRIFPDFRLDSEQSVLDFKETYGFFSLKEIPDRLRCHGQQPGMEISSGIQNLFVASNESYPAWGTFGGMIAGIESIHSFSSEEAWKKYRGVETLSRPTETMR
jgi:hypothetical protein